MADAKDNGSDQVDLHALFGSPERDFLIRNNGDQVKIDSLKGRSLMLLFSAVTAVRHEDITRVFAESYKEKSPEDPEEDSEIIFVSADEDEAAFNQHFSIMPWLAVPFFDSETRNRLKELAKVRRIPETAYLIEDGQIKTLEWIFGAKGYPFPPENCKEMKEEEVEVEAKRNQSLKSILVSDTRDFVVSSHGEKVPVSELEGKIVGLYFSSSSFGSCSDFLQKMKDYYEKLKENGENFEVVLIPLDLEEESFKKGFETMPWLSLPYDDGCCEKLVEYFELSDLPTLVIIGTDGKTLYPNVADAIKEHGTLAYPFTPEKFAELAEIEKAKAEAQTFESVLVSGDQDFVLEKSGEKIKVSDLVGKTILLYFSAHSCPPCRRFTPRLIEAYHKIKAKDQAFEVVFISSDEDQASFDGYFGGMPWLTLPFGDNREPSISRLFKVKGIPTLIALGPTGKTLTKKARELIELHGAGAYPFTEECLKEIVEAWPKKIKHSLHEAHELVLTEKKGYICDGCDEYRKVWSFCCEECKFDLDPKCALEDENKSLADEVKTDGRDSKEETKEGWICDGGVCRKV